MNFAVRLCFWILGIDGCGHARAQAGELDGVFMGAEVDACWTGLRTQPSASAATAAQEFHAQRRP